MDVYLFAALHVRDRAAAIEWYQRFLGEPPSMLPNDTEAVWDLAEHRSLYVEERPDRAGHSAVTMFFADPAELDATVGAIAGRGIEPVSQETYENGVRKVLYRDPDGNEIGYGGGPVDVEVEPDRPGNDHAG